MSIDDYIDQLKKDEYYFSDRGELYFERKISSILDSENCKRQYEIIDELFNNN